MVSLEQTWEIEDPSSRQLVNCITQLRALLVDFQMPDPDEKALRSDAELTLKWIRNTIPEGGKRPSLEFMKNLEIVRMRLSHLFNVEPFNELLKENKFASLWDVVTKGVLRCRILADVENSIPYLDWALREIEGNKIHPKRLEAQISNILRSVLDSLANDMMNPPENLMQKINAVQSRLDRIRNCELTTPWMRQRGIQILFLEIDRIVRMFQFRSGTAEVIQLHPKKAAGAG